MVETSFRTLNQITQDGKLKLDAINSTYGSGIIPKMLALNIYRLINQSIDGLTSPLVLDRVPSGTLGTTFKGYSLIPKVGKSAGDLVAGSTLTNANIGDRFVSMTRDIALEYVAGTKTYNALVKNKKADNVGYGIQKGRTEISIFGNLADGTEIFLNIDDSSIVANQEVFEQNYTVAGKVVAIKITYGGANKGKIVVTFADSDLISNSKGAISIRVTAGLDTSKKSELKGSIENEIVDYNYFGDRMIIDIELDALDTRELIHNLGLNIISANVRLAFDKIIAENASDELVRARKFIVEQSTKSIIDYSTVKNYATAGEYLKEFLIDFIRVKEEIRNRSLQSGNVAIVGGMAIFSIAGYIMQNTDGKTLSANASAVGIRKVATLPSGDALYYDPSYDAKYNTDVATNGTRLDFLGLAHNKNFSLVKTGTPLAIVPLKKTANDDDKETITLQGVKVCATTKDPMARKQALFGRFKFHFSV